MNSRRLSIILDGLALISAEFRYWYLKPNRVAACLADVRTRHGGLGRTASFWNSLNAISSVNELNFAKSSHKERIHRRRVDTLIVKIRSTYVEITQPRSSFGPKKFWN